MIDRLPYTYEYDSVGNRMSKRKQKAFINTNQIRRHYTYNTDNQIVSAVVYEGESDENATLNPTVQY